MKLSMIVLTLGLMISSEHVHYVKPSNTSNTSCFHPPCLTLQQYIQWNDTYFTSGSTFVFLAGNHSMQTVVYLTNISNIFLRGDSNGSNVNVICRNEASIECNRVTNLTLEGLTFMLDSSGVRKSSTALKFLHCDVKIVSCVFLGNNELIVRSILLSYSNITIVYCAFNRNTGDYGGAILALNLSNIFLYGSMFIENKAIHSGGAIYANKSSIKIILTTFVNNVATINDGGAIFCNRRCTLTIESINASLTLNVPSTPLTNGTFFIGNKATQKGGAVFLFSSSAQLKGMFVEIRDNSAEEGGGIYIAWSDFHTITKSLVYTGNRAWHGGAIIIDASHDDYDTVIILSGIFINNTAKICGGAVDIRYKYVLFDDTTVINSSDVRAAMCFLESVITFRGITEFTNNTATSIMYSEASTISYTHHTVFKNNRVEFGVIQSFYSTLLFSDVTLFVNNTAEYNGGAIYAKQTDITFKNMVDFTSNYAENGGAMYFLLDTHLKIVPHTHLTASFNYASGYGGVIYFEDKVTLYKCDPTMYVRILSSDCFMKIDLEYLPTIEIDSKHNVADRDGSFLYGGSLDKCTLRINSTKNIKNFNFLAESNLFKNHTTKEISSLPYGLCFCDDSSVCSSIKSISIHRGQKFIVSLRAIAQGGSTSTQVTAVASFNARVNLNQVIQPLSYHCTNLTYNFYSPEDYEELILRSRGSCGDSNMVQAAIQLTLLPCPHTFIQSNEDCVCEKRLQEYSAQCITDEFGKSYVVQIPGTKFWMKTLYRNESYHGLILYDTCPAEYCTNIDSIAISLSNLDIQCAKNRHGILCGACASNHSLLLGSSKCQVCSNIYLALLFLFAAAGVILVVFLSILRLTVATGMINSVILYANILQVNKRIFFPNSTINILTVFIAWLNLDLGFQTCFYDGMDAYAQTWLQFAFPLYIWILISLIILSSRYSITMSKLIGHNPIAVLATLILMSYTKVLKIIIEVYSSADLAYPDNETYTVWLKDANVPYLQSKHLLLTVLTTLVLILLFIPYTLLLLLGYKLYSLSGKNYFHWLNKIKPLLDSYYAPYNVHTHYWTGFLLLVRCALYIVFSFGGKNKSLLAINITFTAIGILSGYLVAGKIYKSIGANVIEASIYLNLIALSAIFYTHDTTNTIPIYSMIGIVFVTMSGIILYHFHLLYTAKLLLCLKIKSKISTFKENIIRKKKDTLSPAITAKSSHDPYKVATKTVIELREPLLEQ